jgi:hypothetical protein
VPEGETDDGHEAECLGERAAVVGEDPAVPQVGPGPQPRPRVLRPVPATAGGGHCRTEGEASKVVRDEVRGDGDRGAQDDRHSESARGVAGSQPSVR